MMKKRKRNSGPGWSDAKERLRGMSQSELLAVVRDLYTLSSDNRDFLNAKLITGSDALEPYRQAVENALYPDVFRHGQVDLSGARKAISRYRKASVDPQGLAELMVIYVEAGTRFTRDFGDIDEGFYASLTSVFEEATLQVLSLPPEVRKDYIDRLGQVVKMAERMGWGYYDTIQDLYESAFGGDR